MKIVTDGSSYEIPKVTCKEVNRVNMLIDVMREFITVRVESSFSKNPKSKVTY